MNHHPTIKQQSNKMGTPTITINMDAPCTECGKGGATQSGLCLECIGKQIPKAGPRRDFKKIKVDGNTGFLELAYTERVKAGDTITENDMGGTFKRAVHGDLLTAMQNFIPHLLVITEVKEATEFEGVDLDVFDKLGVPGCAPYTVTGIAIGGEDEHQGVTIIGRKTLRNKKALNIIAPFTKFQGSEGEPRYRLADELWSAYIDLEKEVGLFLDHGKCAPEAQLKMDLETAA